MAESCQGHPRSPCLPSLLYVSAVREESGDGIGHPRSSFQKLTGNGTLQKAATHTWAWLELQRAENEGSSVAFIF